MTGHAIWRPLDLVIMGRISDAREKLLRVAFDLIWDRSYGSVSVDQICEKARVKKGSFYYFFPSKSDLAVAAFEDYWNARRPQYEEIFAPDVPPLERLEKFCTMIYECQKERLKKTGRVLGCPFASVGSELSTQDEKIRLKSEEMFHRVCHYLETALRDGHKQGVIAKRDFKAGAESIYAYVIGMLLQAKIKRDVEILKHLAPTVLQIAGMKVVPEMLGV